MKEQTHNSLLILSWKPQVVVGVFEIRGTSLEGFKSSKKAEPIETLPLPPFSAWLNTYVSGEVGRECKWSLLLSPFATWISYPSKRVCDVSGSLLLSPLATWTNYLSKWVGDVSGSLILSPLATWANYLSKWVSGSGCKWFPHTSCFHLPR